MGHKPAQYLLRFDDLSPMMNRPLWLRFETLITEFQVKPMLAVIPDDHDLNWHEKTKDPEFWQKMRTLESQGATIAMHGYQHVCTSRGRSLLALHRKTEFAGVDYETQRSWIRNGLKILRENGLHPRLWVAPRHGFDNNTLRALVAENLPYLSDGFARAPVMRGGVTWIPQQLWAPVVKDRGLWTICVHPETARTADLNALRSFVAANQRHFTSFDQVIADWPARRLGLFERIYEIMAQRLVERRHAIKRQQARNRSSR